MTGRCVLAWSHACERIGGETSWTAPQDNSWFAIAGERHTRKSSPHASRVIPRETRPAVQGGPISWDCRIHSRCIPYTSAYFRRSCDGCHAGAACGRQNRHSWPEDDGPGRISMPTQRKPCWYWVFCLAHDVSERFYVADWGLCLVPVMRCTLGLLIRRGGNPGSLANRCIDESKGRLR